MGLLFGSVFLLSACGSKDEVANKDGSCSQGVVDLNNTLVESFKVFANTQDHEILHEIADLCREFESLLGGRSCVGQILTTREQVTISYATHEKNCSISKTLSDLLSL